MTVCGQVNLDKNFSAQGEVRFPGAQIGRNFECRGGSFENPQKDALNIAGIKIGGDLHLGASFMARGAVRLAGATIGGDFSCRQGAFKNPRGNALFCQSARVRGAFFFDRLKACSGVVDLNSASVHSLVDDLDSWPREICLNGFRYQEFAGNSPVTASDRLLWLEKQRRGDRGTGEGGSDFRPQPWQQLRNVLRKMGHYEAAREVGVAFERRKRHCGQIGQTSETPAWWCPTVLWPIPRFLYQMTARLLHMGYGGLVDYGYRPLKLLLIAALVWGICAGGFFFAARYGSVFVPREMAIYQNKYEAVCGPPDHVRWTDCKAIQRKYPLFYPAVYSLNVLLPVGNLGQEAAWRPMTTKWPGIFTQWAVWFETLFGWVASLILIAVVSGLAKRDE